MTAAVPDALMPTIAAEDAPDAVLVDGDWISPSREAHARDLTKSWADAAQNAGCPPAFVARMRTFVEVHDRLHAAALASPAARPAEAGADTDDSRWAVAEEIASRYFERPDGRWNLLRIDVAEALAGNITPPGARPAEPAVTSVQQVLEHLRRALDPS